MVQVERNDVAYIRVTGFWKLGETVGRHVDAGQGDRSVSAYREDQRVPFGAAMVRVRGSRGVKQASGVLKPDVSGELEFTCNDRDRANNEGVARIEIVVLPGKLLGAWERAALALSAESR